jgi:hypothetical protein
MTNDRDGDAQGLGRAGVPKLWSGESSAVFALYKKGWYGISVDARVGARQPDRELLTGHRRHTGRHGRYRSSVRGSFPFGSAGGDSLG